MIVFCIVPVVKLNITRSYEDLVPGLTPGGNILFFAKIIRYLPRKTLLPSEDFASFGRCCLFLGFVLS